MSGTTVTSAAVLRSTSSNLDPRYLASQFVPTITVNHSDNTSENVLEVFSPRMIKAIDSIRRIGLDRYKGDHITTLAYQRFRNTTCWWMILLASKQIHPLSIQLGDGINYPNIEIMRRAQISAIQRSARVPTFTEI